MPFGIIQTRRPRRPPGQKTAVKGIVPGKLPKNSLPFEASASRRFSRNDSSGQTRRTHSPSKRARRAASQGTTPQDRPIGLIPLRKRARRAASQGTTPQDRPKGGGTSPGLNPLRKRALRAASPGTTPTARPKGSGLRTHSLPKNDRMNGYISMICWLATSS
jgi:hypothetical protein